MDTQCIVGAAGTGKSTELRKRMEDGAKYLLTSTTGISAVNLGPGVTTINSALGFYDLRSLKYEHSRGYIKSKLLNLARNRVKTLVIDEVSMLQAETLQIIYEAAQQAQGLIEARAGAINHYKDNSGESLNGQDATGLMLVGDFCQLAPIGNRQADGKPGLAKYAFEAQCWNEFEKDGNITHLTKIWRQEDVRFCNALKLVRQGRECDAAIEIKNMGVEFSMNSNEDFDGITLFAVNQQVDVFNARRLEQLPGEVVSIPSKRWGKELGEWKGIPEVLELKDGCLVMILVNQPKTFDYVNGDLATFHLCYDKQPIDGSTQWQHNVKTKRGYKGPIPFATRRNVSYNETPDVIKQYRDTYEKTNWGKALENEDPSSKRWKAIYLEYIDAHTMKGNPYYDPKEEGIVVGEVEYMPLRVAYASTVHKVQGLTLDNVQVNIGHYWFGNPSTVYVALSRARSIKGLRIVGDVGRLARRIKTDARVKRWV